MNKQREDLPLGLLLDILNYRFRERIYAAYAAAGFEDVRAPHDVVLGLLSAEGERVVDLAKKANTTKQAMGYLVAYLEEHGYVERVPDPDDGRAQIVRRTARGWEVSNLGRRLILEIQGEWAQQFGVERMEQLVLMLRELVKTI